MKEQTIRKLNKPKRINKMFGALLMLLLIVFAVLFFVNKIKLDKMKRDLIQVQTIATEQEMKNEELKRQLSNEDELMEKLVKENGYAKPDERVFVMVN